MSWGIAFEDEIVIPNTRIETMGELLNNIAFHEGMINKYKALIKMYVSSNPPFLDSESNKQMSLDELEFKIEEILLDYRYHVEVLSKLYRLKDFIEENNIEIKTLWY